MRLRKGPAQQRPAPENAPAANLSDPNFGSQFEIRPSHRMDSMALKEQPCGLGALPRGEVNAKSKSKVSSRSRVGSRFGGHGEAGGCANHGLQGCDAVSRCRGACLQW